MARGGGGFYPSRGKIIAISFPTLCSEGVAGLIPYDKLAVISHSTKCSEGVADLVSASLFGFWFVGLFGFWFADLCVWFAIFSFWFSGFCIWFLYFSFWFARFLVSDSWDFGFWFADLVSDSRVLVSDSLLLIRGKFLIRGLFVPKIGKFDWN